MENKPIIIIDDDNEDLDFIKDAVAELNIKNEIILFDDGLKFLEFIKETQNRAFFILCDINMHKLSGLELKKIIFEDEVLRLKCVPFIFLSTSGASREVLKAYSYGVQGFFVKPNTQEGTKEMMEFIVKYWSHSIRQII